MPSQGPGLVNRFRPTALSFNSYGWKGSPLYNRADVPSQWVEGVGGLDRTVIEQQLAYEWLNSSEAGGPGNIWTNPPFLSGAAGRLMSGAQSGASPARILRGFIRRSESDIGDIASMSRLYFMYNPEQITRDYVSYLDQGALDPFNTVFQSGNLVAPPSYMDFNFTLFFDRQEEAVIASNPGVFVDYQYFDLVVRNVVPTTDPNAMNGTLPDNGVMMVNPRDITVVFSPQITVQGRPSNARISFTKFTHRMVPTRMQIDLTMRVTYFGPLKDMTPYVKEEAVTAATIPYSEIEETYHLSVEQILIWQAQVIEWIGGLVSGAVGGGGGGSEEVPVAGDVSPAIIAGQRLANQSSRTINEGILKYAKDQVAANGTKYLHGSSTWKAADCSGLVYRAFADLNYAAPTMKWSGQTACAGMWEKIKAGGNTGSKGKILFEADGSKSPAERAKAIRPYLGLLAKGDLLYRINARERDSNHVSWFDDWRDTAGDSTMYIYAAQSPTRGVGASSIEPDEFASTYTGAFRPYTGSGDSVGTTNYGASGPQ